jgi:hypothetical protein
MNLTEKGSLDFGVEYPADSGERHYDFEIRLGTIGDTIAAYEDPAILGGCVSNMRVNVAVLANCIVSLGTIPKESITAGLLDTAIDSDYDVLTVAQESLKKKLKDLKLSAATSASPKSSSDSTASAPTASTS